MLIIAKFASRCSSCRKPISAGDKVEWSKGSAVRHPGCGATDPLPARSATQGRRRFTRCEGWGADNPHAPREGHCSECAGG
jgi:hypothetical protein